MPIPSSPLWTPRPITRRDFIRQSSAAAAFLGAPAILRGQNLNSKINIASIGAGGKGSSDGDGFAGLGENIVGLCDVDKTRLDERGAKFPKAKVYQDFRKMLEEMKEIDAVHVSTPDHMHAYASVMAMRMGKHVFCQKPLTHDVYEARLMRETAAKYKVVTQMGNQGSAANGLRAAMEVVQAGALGPIRQVHVWSNRPIWPQGIPRPTQVDPVPDTLAWDLWLGTAPERPFVKEAYHPFAWRGWVDFGTGALGDMACHTANLPFRALKLGYPTSVEAKSSGFNGETYPSSSEIRFEFPARADMPPVSFFWYDGGNFPPQDVVSEVSKYSQATGTGRRGGGGRDQGGPAGLPIAGCLLIGDRGQLFAPDDYGARYVLFPEATFKDYKPPTPFIPRSPGAGGNYERSNYAEWIQAIKGGPPAFSNFDIAAYLTEIILLGCVALRTGEKIIWDGPRMRATNTRKASQFVRREYRKGWEL